MKADKNYVLKVSTEANTEALRKVDRDFESLRKKLERPIEGPLTRRDQAIYDSQRGIVEGRARRALAEELVRQQARIDREARHRLYGRSDRDLGRDDPAFVAHRAARLAELRTQRATERALLAAQSQSIENVTTRRTSVIRAATAGVGPTGLSERDVKPWAHGARLLGVGGLDGMGEMAGTLGAGGLAVAGITIGARLLGDMAVKARELKEEFDAGRKSGADIADELAKSIPVLGTIYKSGRDIRALLDDLITGDATYLAQQQARAAWQKDLSAKQVSWHKEITTQLKTQTDEAERYRRAAIIEGTPTSSARERVAADFATIDRRDAAQKTLNDTIKQINDRTNPVLAGLTKARRGDVEGLADNPELANTGLAQAIKAFQEYGGDAELARMEAASAQQLAGPSAYKSSAAKGRELKQAALAAMAEIDARAKALEKQRTDEITALRTQARETEFRATEADNVRKMESEKAAAKELAEFRRNLTEQMDADAFRRRMERMGLEGKAEQAAYESAVRAADERVKAAEDHARQVREAEGGVDSEKTRAADDAAMAARAGALLEKQAARERFIRTTSEKIVAAERAKLADEAARGSVQAELRMRMQAIEDEFAERRRELQKLLETMSLDPEQRNRAEALLQGLDAEQKEAEKEAQKQAAERQLAIRIGQAGTLAGFETEEMRRRAERTGDPTLAREADKIDTAMSYFNRARSLRDILNDKNADESAKSQAREQLDRLEGDLGNALSDTDRSKHTLRQQTDATFGDVVDYSTYAASAGALKQQLLSQGQGQATDPNTQVLKDILNSMKDLVEHAKQPVTVVKSFRKNH